MFGDFIVLCKGFFHFLCHKSIKYFVWIILVGKGYGTQGVQKVYSKVTVYNIGFLMQVTGREYLGTIDLTTGDVFAYQNGRILFRDTGGYIEEQLI